MRILRSLIMLVLSVFLIQFLTQSAYAQLAPASQPVFMAGNWVLVDASIAMPTALDPTWLMVAPANLPGHLNYTDPTYISNKIVLAGSLKTIMPAIGNIREVATIIKGPSLVSTPADNYKKTRLFPAGSLAS